MLKGIYPFGENIYQTLQIYAILVAVSLHFKVTAVKFVVMVQTWETLPKPNFVKKNYLRGIPIFGIFIPKINNFGDFAAVSPHFKSDNGEIWREGTDLGHPPSPLIL